ncbi:Murein peptide amidase A [Gallionellaceae bacterium]|nr:Murein peptide amidase A [Gallionellaceae bacterium]
MRAELTGAPPIFFRTDYISASVTRFIHFLFLAVLVLQSPVARADQGGIDAWCAYLVNRLHSVSADSCHPQDFVAAEEFTAQGNALVWRDFGVAKKSAASENQKRILLIGGIHGDELTSVSIVFRWMGWIMQPAAALYHWRVIPLANPDGLKARPSTRHNANGVDINRNFHTPDWDKDAQNYWVKRTNRDPRRYPGEAAGSEIETRWLEAQIDEFRPDMIISVHAPYNLLDYDGPVPQPMRFGRLSLNRLGVYPGSLGNYGGLFKQVPVVTIELPNATVMPARSEQLAMWQDMLKWMTNNIDMLASKLHPEKSADATAVLSPTGSESTGPSELHAPGSK